MSVSVEMISFTDEPLADCASFNLSSKLTGELFINAREAFEHWHTTLDLAKMVALVPAFDRELSFRLMSIVGTVAEGYSDFTTRIVQFDFVVGENIFRPVSGGGDLQGLVVVFRCEVYRDDDDKFFYNLREV